MKQITDWLSTTDAKDLVLCNLNSFERKSVYEFCEKNKLSTITKKDQHSKTIYISRIPPSLEIVPTLTRNVIDFFIEITNIPLPTNNVVNVSYYLEILNQVIPDCK